jgi:hypothetical protein
MRTRRIVTAPRALSARCITCFECSAWERDWREQQLPEGFHDFFLMMGEALHDTVKYPDVAWNFGCLPEQLLERVKRLPVD